MSRGIIYVMTTVVPGLVKIGKTGTENFESRMYQLERNGYFNVVGLKRKFAIEVEDYDEKEVLIDEIFAKSRVMNSELFALDADLVVQLLASLEGRQVYPQTVTKDEVFTYATVERQLNADVGNLPAGEYYLERQVRGYGKVTAKMCVENGVYTVIKGCKCLPIRASWAPEVCRMAPIENGVLLEDVTVSSPSMAGFLVLGQHTNGWTAWKDKDGRVIDTYRRM